MESIGGATLNVIRKRIRATNPRKKRYQRIFIVAGTNDTASKRPAERIVSDVKETILAAKRIASSVILSSIPPRCDSRANTEKIKAVNQLAEASATSEDCRFVNNDQNFCFRDDSVDTSLLLPDQLHLSSGGVNKLVKNLGLEAKSKCRIHKPVIKTPNTWCPPPSVSTPTPLMSLSPSPIPSPPADSPLYFRGGGSPLSNFFEAPLSIWNMTFPSSEHAFQYRKSIALGENSAGSNILHAKSPLDAKRIGDTLTPNAQWNDTRQGIMYEILKTKARQCPHFHQQLKDSQERPLVENTANPFWGRGQHGQGLNMLGRLLMMLRSELPMLQTSAQNFTPRPRVAPPKNHYGHSQPNSRQQQLRCFNCGEASHNKTTCRHNAPLRCYSCSGLGHKKKFCRRQ